VSAVISAVGITNGAKSQVEAQIASLGQNVILIFSGSVTRGGLHTGWGSAGTLSVEDADAIRREIPGVSLVSPEVRTVSQVAAGNQNWYTQIIGESAEYLELRQWSLADGTMFTDQDVRSANKVCVIGKTVADQLYGNDNPVGQIMRVKNVPFVVVGTLTPKGFSMSGSDQDDQVLMPYTSGMKRVLGQTTLRTINVQAAKASLLTPVQKDLTDLLRQRHRIQIGKDDDFNVRNQQEIAEAATATARTMSGLLGGVALVSLIVGGIGIMNIMLVSVTERTREIGIRMAVGAHGRDILLQFLIEATTLSSFGGILGILLGLGASKAISSVQGWPVQTSTTWMLIAFISSAAVGVFFGFYPAHKASRLDPIDALRYE
jgi:putative ABC transport system permease protein